ncbi:hypothetical protein AB0K00_40850 [Dactylosporangium sp. NPDC049525]|uniref:hypothetical protein n=1 Tax=Dactylosporangium sp. NPDC049525 TaxID=3154730 RepID=UPI0034336D8A
MATPPTDPPADRITELLHRELRTARSAAMDEGTSPDEITADLTERVRRLRRLNDAGWRPGAGAPDDEPRDAGDDPTHPPVPDPAAS